MGARHDREAAEQTKRRVDADHRDHSSAIADDTRDDGQGPRQAPGLTLSQTLRYLWGQLTSMRTAIILLIALAVAAIPGSLGPKILPQRPNNPVLVREWIAAHPGWGEFLDRIGAFDVYGSPWFAAIYLLLLVSMVGCLIPRTTHYLRRLRRRTSEPREYVHELGNLIFHISLLGVLAGVAYSSLVGFKGSVIVPEGQAFSNVLSQYDDFTAGAAFDRNALTPFTLWVDKFDVSFERGQVQHGAARQFAIAGRLASAPTPDSPPIPVTVEVNSPVIVGGTMVNLIGHGYAPVVTVTDAAGHPAFTGPVVFLPQDGNFTSLGVIKAPDARPQRVAFESIFVPSQSDAKGVGPRSTFPDADNPMLWGTAWEGAPKAETGAPENIFSLDKSGLTQVMDGAAPASFRLKPGESYTLSDGTKLTFDSWRRWTKLQISTTPGLPIVYGSVAIGVLALMVSLFVRPRREAAAGDSQPGASGVSLHGTRPEEDA